MKVSEPGGLRETWIEQSYGQEDYAQPTLRLRAEDEDYRESLHVGTLYAVVDGEIKSKHVYIALEEPESNELMLPDQGQAILEDSALEVQSRTQAHYTYSFEIEDTEEVEIPSTDRETTEFRIGSRPLGSMDNDDLRDLN